jgi:hypothetical protein
MQHIWLRVNRILREQLFNMQQKFSPKQNDCSHMLKLLSPVGAGTASACIPRCCQLQAAPKCLKKPYGSLRKLIFTTN